MGDCEDPYLYAAFPISDWQATEQGKWIMANVTEPPVFHVQPDVNNFGFRVVITGKLNSQSETYFRLKYK
jgi:P pilus assembly chaperone PapD